MKWSELAWSEIPEVLARCGHSALLPVGATEQHGPHLGTGVDFMIAEQLCHKVSEQTGVPVLPVMPYGCSIGHSQRWPGTLGLQPVTLIQMIKEIGDWAWHSHIRRLFIVNAHVTNAAPLRCALEMLRAEHDGFMVSVLNTATLSERVQSFHAHDAMDWHANDAETSLMLHLAPQAVRPEHIPQADDPDRTTHCVFAHPVNRTSMNGVTGSPSLATAAKGAEWFDWMVQDLAQLVHAGILEEHPLNHPYYNIPEGSRHEH